MFRVLITRRAEKDLDAIPRFEREAIAEKIALLGQDPGHPVLDVKKLQGSPFYRLRVGDWRVIFDRKNAVRIIEIIRVRHRREVYR